MNQTQMLPRRRDLDDATISDIHDIAYSLLDDQGDGDIICFELIDELLIDFGYALDNGKVISLLFASLAALGVAVQ